MYTYIFQTDFIFVSVFILWIDILFFQIYQNYMNYIEKVKYKNKFLNVER